MHARKRPTVNRTSTQRNTYRAVARNPSRGPEDSHTTRPRERLTRLDPDLDNLQTAKRRGRVVLQGSALPRAYVSRACLRRSCALADNTSPRARSQTATRRYVQCTSFWRFVQTGLSKKAECLWTRVSGGAQPISTASGRGGPRRWILPPRPHSLAAWPFLWAWAWLCSLLLPVQALG